MKRQAKVSNQYWWEYTKVNLDQILIMLTGMSQPKRVEKEQQKSESGHVTFEYPKLSQQVPWSSCPQVMVN